jgi:uroporphyrinogen III methyltransferase/synthase
VDVGKRYGRRATPQPEITSLLLDFARAGKRVVRLKGGDPLTFARGAEEALALAAAGIPFEIVPGISSPIGAAAFAGMSLTHRDLSSSVTFITGSDQAGKEWSPDAWKKLATATGTICVLMGMRRIREISQAIIDGGRAVDTPAAVVRWAARPEQKTVTATLGSIADEAEKAGLSSPAVIIIGEVVSLRKDMNWNETRPLFGRRILVPRAVRQAAQTAEEIRERGAKSLLIPAIAIEPPEDRDRLDQSLGRLAKYDWVVFTSQNGVLCALDRLLELGLDARAFGAAKIAAIGSRTAAALVPYGLRADFVADKFVAESLAEGLLAQVPEGGSVLLLRAAEAREVLPEALREAGRVVDVTAAYSTHPVTGEERERLAAAIQKQAEVVLLTSSSMVRSVCEALGRDAASLLSHKTVVAIGPVTEKTCQELGVRVDIVAAEYTIQGALDALERVLGP